MGSVLPQAIQEHGIWEKYIYMLYSMAIYGGYRRTRVIHAQESGGSERGEKSTITQRTCVRLV